MKFMYDHAWLPIDFRLLIDINSAANRLYNKLKYLDIKSLEISDYNKRYLNHHLKNMIGTLQLFSYILSWSVTSNNVPLKEFVFVDYGGGSGILSLLAKELGIGIVIYNDIYDVSCKDAMVIGESVEKEADYYVKGDIDDLIRFLSKNAISCNAIASNDVIEHIYNIEDFISKLHLLSDGSMSVAMASGANSLNPLIDVYLMKKQLEIEYKDREKKMGHKERDSIRSYLKIRKEIITNLAKNLSKKEINKLARNTRGMIESDIKKSVDKYLKTKKFPQKPSHPTNTCDPYTGNWAEHLMNPYHLKKILLRTGFKVKILNGYYPRYQDIFKRQISNLNIFINIFRKQGIIIAPFFMIYAKKYPFLEK